MSFAVPTNVRSASRNNHSVFWEQTNTRLYPAGQGSANRRYWHVMGKATLGNVVDTSQTARPFAGHFQPADTIISIGTFLQRFSKKSTQK